MQPAELAKTLARIQGGGGPAWRRENYAEALRGITPAGFAQADRHGSTVLHYLADIGAEDTMLYLWQKGHLVAVNLEVEDNNGLTPVERAAMTNQAGACALLAHEFGVNYHRFHSDRTTVADRANKHGKHIAGEYLQDLARQQLRKQMIEAPPALGLRDVEGRTALHYAALGRNWEMAETLVARGADWNAPDAEGESPLWYVLRGSDEEGYEFYKKLGFAPIQANRRSENLLHAVVYSGNRKMIEDLHILIEAEGRESNLWDLMDENGKAPLHLTAEMPREKAVRTARLLIELGADPAACGHSMHGHSVLPVTQALKHGHMALGELLLDATFAAGKPDENDWKKSQEWAHNLACVIRGRSEEMAAKLLDQSVNNPVLRAAFDYFARSSYLDRNLEDALQDAQASEDPKGECEKAERIAQKIRKAYPGQAPGADASKETAPEPGL